MLAFLLGFILGANVGALALAIVSINRDSARRMPSARTLRLVRS